MTGTDRSATALQMIDVSFSYERNGKSLPVLRRGTLTVLPGEVVALVGRSGSGKSTVISLAGGLALPSEGRIVVGGIDLAASNGEERARVRRHNVGMVFQDFRLIDRLTAVENVALPLQLLGSARKHALAIARQHLDAVGLADRASHRPAEMSGGEQQRVSIARATIATPSLILADEPTGSLDTELRDEILDILVTAVRQRSAGLVLVTHDPLVAAHASRVITLEGGAFVEPSR